MLSFRIVWSNPAGRFGFVTLADCVDLSDAVSWFASARGETIPPDAEIDTIRPA